MPRNALFRYISKDTRKRMPSEDFAASGMRFPIQKREDVHAAVVRLNSIPEAERASVKAGIVRIAKRKGWEDALPSSWGYGKKAKKQKKAMMSDMSFSDIQDAVRDALNDAEGLDNSTPDGPYLWICDIFPSYVIYRIGYGTDEMFKRSYVMGSDGEVTLGDKNQVRKATSYETVTSAEMSLNSLFSIEDGDFIVYQDAKLFEAGSYPDKNLEVDPEDLLSMVQNFSGPIDGDLEHIIARTDPGRVGNLSALKGLAQIRAMRVDPSDPWTLRGDVAVHKFIDPKLEAKGVSLEIPIDNPTRVPFFTLTAKPRVAGAALMSELEDLYSHKEQEPMNEEEKKALAALTELLKANPNLLSQVATMSATTHTTTPQVPPEVNMVIEQNKILFAQMETQNRQAREERSVALFDRLIGSQVGRKFTPAQRDALRDEFVAAGVLFSADDSKPNNEPQVALFDAETKAPKRVASRFALFSSIVAKMVDSMGQTAVTPGEVFGSDNGVHLIHSSSPVTFSNPDGSEDPAELEKWEKALTEANYLEHGYAPDGTRR